MAYGDNVKPKAGQSNDKKAKPKKNPHSSRMTPAQHKKFSKAVKDGIITKGQHDKLTAGLLEAIIKKKEKERFKGKGQSNDKKAKGDK